jgi:hypothetical protein
MLVALLLQQDNAKVASSTLVVTIPFAVSFCLEEEDVLMARRSLERAGWMGGVCNVEGEVAPVVGLLWLFYSPLFSTLVFFTFFELSYSMQA